MSKIEVENLKRALTEARSEIEDRKLSRDEYAILDAALDFFMSEYLDHASLHEQYDDADTLRRKLRRISEQYT